eukprot:SM000096S24860  [mRNA]  locus=s96:101630:108529:- [translate_table: standard]
MRGPNGNGWGSNKYLRRDAEMDGKHRKAMNCARKELRPLLNALRFVESSNRVLVPDGDAGASIGPYQISEEYHRDAWRNKSHVWTKCRDLEHAETTVVNYWLKYCPEAVATHDWETLAKTHNGTDYKEVQSPACFRSTAVLEKDNISGPQGPIRPNTVYYWSKVMRHLKQHEHIPEHATKVAPRRPPEFARHAVGARLAKVVKTNSSGLQWLHHTDESEEDVPDAPSSSHQSISPPRGRRALTRVASAPSNVEDTQGRRSLSEGGDTIKDNPLIPASTSSAASEFGQAFSKDEAARSGRARFLEDGRSNGGRSRSISMGRSSSLARRPSRIRSASPRPHGMQSAGVDTLALPPRPPRGLFLTSPGSSLPSQSGSDEDNATLLEQLSPSALANYRYWATYWRFPEKVKKELAASLIQSTWRMHKARTMFLHIKLAAEMLQRRRRASSARQTFLSQRQAARVIQQQWRGSQVARRAAAARLEARMQAEEMEKVTLREKAAARVILRSWQAYRRKKEEVAVKIQSRWRCEQVRRQYLATRSHIVALQQLWRSRVARHSATTVIQSHWKGGMQRASFARQLERRAQAALTIQGRWKSNRVGEATRLELRKAHAAASVIQARWRGRCTRSQYIQERRAATSVQRAWRAHRERKRLHDAAVAVQRIRRGLVYQRGPGEQPLQVVTSSNLHSAFRLPGEESEQADDHAEIEEGRSSRSDHPKTLEKDETGSYREHAAIMGHRCSIRQERSELSINKCHGSLMSSGAHQEQLAESVNSKMAGGSLELDGEALAAPQERLQAEELDETTLSMSELVRRIPGWPFLSEPMKEFLEWAKGNEEAGKKLLARADVPQLVKNRLDSQEVRELLRRSLEGDDILKAASSSPLDELQAAPSGDGDTWDEDVLIGSPLRADHEADRSLGASPYIRELSQVEGGPVELEHSPGRVSQEEALLGGGSVELFGGLSLSRIKEGQVAGCMGTISASKASSAAGEEVEDTDVGFWEEGVSVARWVPASPSTSIGGTAADGVDGPAPSTSRRATPAARDTGAGARLVDVQVPAMSEGRVHPPVKAQISPGRGGGSVVLEQPPLAGPVDSLPPSPSLPVPGGKALSSPSSAKKPFLSIFRSKSFSPRTLHSAVSSQPWSTTSSPVTPKTLSFDEAAGQDNQAAKNPISAGSLPRDADASSPLSGGSPLTSSHWKRSASMKDRGRRDGDSEGSRSSSIPPLLIQLCDSWEKNHVDLRLRTAIYDQLDLEPLSEAGSQALRARSSLQAEISRMQAIELEPEVLSAAARGVREQRDELFSTIAGKLSQAGRQQLYTDWGIRKWATGRLKLVVYKLLWIDASNAMVECKVPWQHEGDFGPDYIGVAPWKHPVQATASDALWPLSAQ